MISSCRIIPLFLSYSPSESVICKVTRASSRGCRKMALCSSTRLNSFVYFGVPFVQEVVKSTSAIIAHARIAHCFFKNVHLLSIVHPNLRNTELFLPITYNLLLATATKSSPSGVGPSPSNEIQHFFRMLQVIIKTKKSLDNQGFSLGCGRRDLNPHALWAPPPQDGVSAVPPRPRSEI